MLSFFDAIREWWQARRTRKITPEQVQKRVERGAAYLDEVDPTWYRRIDAEALALENGRHCVLGQLHGEFRLGLGRSHLISLSSAPRASLSPVAYGFKCVEGVPEEWQKRDYDLLDAAWMEAVRARQALDRPTDDPGAGLGDSLPDNEVDVTPAAEVA